MDLIEYIIIEKKDDIDSIKIIPIVKEFVFKDDGTEQKLVELDASFRKIPNFTVLFFAKNFYLP